MMNQSEEIPYFEKVSDLYNALEIPMAQDSEFSMHSLLVIPFFYGQESDEAVAYHKAASALGGLTKIEDIVPLTRFLISDGWWITGQTIFANGGYTTR